MESNFGRKAVCNLLLPCENLHRVRVAGLLLVSNRQRLNQEGNRLIIQIRLKTNCDSHDEDRYNRRNRYVVPGLTVL